MAESSKSGGLNSILKAKDEAETNLDKVLEDSFLDAMKNTLGEGSAQAILFHLGLLQYVKKPREFHENLCHLLKGTQQAITIERMIIKELYRRVGIPFVERSEFDFYEQVKLITEGMRWKRGGLKIEQ